MRKKIACGLMVLACGVWAASCKTGAPVSPVNTQTAAHNPQAAPAPGRGADVNGALAEVSSFTDELLKRIEGASDPATGLAAAQKYFESRKDEVRATLVAARGSREARESAEAKSRLLESEVDNTARLSGLRTKYLDDSMNDPAFKAKLDKLVGDYQELFRE